MTDLVSDISFFIEDQFPAIYREEGDVLIDFVRAYFEFLEQSSTDPTVLSRTIFNNRDIDRTLDQFIVFFKQKYMNQFPYAQATDQRFIIKHIIDYYRAKGTVQSTKLLMRMLFNEDADLYYPGQDVFKLSDSKWYIPRYIEVTTSPLTKTYIEKQITGSRSGATAFVEGVVQKRIQGRIIDVVFLSNIKGTFITDELVSDSSTYINAPRIIGSLSGLNIINGGRNNSVGDIVDIIHSTGKQGQARITAIENASGRVNFAIEDGGSGYTLDDFTDVYVATAMIGVDNSNTDNQFFEFEPVIQKREQLDLLSSDDVGNTYFTDFASNTEFVVGDFLTGIKNYQETYNSGTSPATNGINTVFPRPQQVSGNNVYIVVSNSSVTNEVISPSEYSINATSAIFSVPPEGVATVKIFEYQEVANGLIVSIANTDGSGSIITDPSANTRAVCVIESGSFANQISIDFTSNVNFSSNEPVIEGSVVSIDYSSNSGTFSNNDLVEMRVYSDPSDVGNTQVLTNYAYGTVSASNSTTLILDPAWGEFITGETFGVYHANGTLAVSAIIDQALTTSAGAIGTISDLSDSNTIVIDVNTGVFNTGSIVRGSLTGLIGEVSNVTYIGASEVWYNGNTSANGLIQTVTNTAATGFVVGQNTSFVGLYGNTTAFSYIDGANFTISTRRELIKDLNLIANPNKTDIITIIGTGNGATFRPGSLENEETITLNTDLISGRNVANVEYLDIQVNAEQSAIGFVDSVTINNGGTSYTNASVVTFSGGGYGAGEPTIPAYGVITTDGSGTITSITITNPGAGFYSEPTIVLPSTGGTVANVEPVISFGYGFPKNPTGDQDTEFQYLFTSESFTIGTISSLTGINPGADYNTDPFVKVYNRYIATFDRRDMIIEYSLVSGSFKDGEVIEQDGSNFARILSNDGTFLTVRRESFNFSDSGSNIIGAESGAVATLVDLAEDLDGSRMGDNADISGTVIVANGVAVAAEIIDSGYGYLHNVEASLERDQNPFIVTANTIVETQGVGTGYWETRTSHPDESAKIHDNNYYQEFSYDIQTGVSIDRYREIVRNVLHVAGTKLFGTVIKNQTINNPITVSKEIELE